MLCLFSTTTYSVSFSLCMLAGLSTGWYPFALSPYASATNEKLSLKGQPSALTNSSRKYLKKLSLWNYPAASPPIEEFQENNPTQTTASIYSRYKTDHFDARGAWRDGAWRNEVPPLTFRKLRLDETSIQRSLGGLANLARFRNGRFRTIAPTSQCSLDRWRSTHGVQPAGSSALFPA